MAKNTIVFLVVLFTSGIFAQEPNGERPIRYDLILGRTMNKNMVRSATGTIDEEARRLRIEMYILEKIPDTTMIDIRAKINGVQQPPVQLPACPTMQPQPACPISPIFNVATSVDWAMPIEVIPPGTPSGSIINATVDFYIPDEPPFMQYEVGGTLMN